MQQNQNQKRPILKDVCVQLKRRRPSFIRQCLKKRDLRVNAQIFDTKALAVASMQRQRPRERAAVEMIIHASNYRSIIPNNNDNGDDDDEIEMDDGYDWSNMEMLKQKSATAPPPPQPSEAHILLF